MIMNNCFEKIVKKYVLFYLLITVEAEGILFYLDGYYIAHRLNVLEGRSGGPNEWNYCDG